MVKLGRAGGKTSNRETPDQIGRVGISAFLSNDPGKVDSNFFCYAAAVLSPNKNVLIFTQRMHKPTRRPLHFERVFFCVKRF